MTTRVRLFAVGGIYIMAVLCIYSVVGSWEVEIISILVLFHWFNLEGSGGLMLSNPKRC